VLIFGVSCNRLPEACLNIGAKKLNLGQEVSIADCSKNSYQSIIETGDGARYVDEESISHFYTAPGAFPITLTVYSKKSDRSMEIKEFIEVFAPAKSSLLGQWMLVKVDTYEELFVDPDVDIFSQPKIESENFSEEYSFEEDTIRINHSGETFYTFDNKLSYTYDRDKALLTFANGPYPILVYRGNSMVVRGPYFKGYKLLHFERKV
jgi:hypothetical protein